MSSCDGCMDADGCALTAAGSVAMEECPCRNCLVKVTCQKACDDLAQHQYIVYTSNRKPKRVKVKKGGRKL